MHQRSVEYYIRLKMIALRIKSYGGTIMTDRSRQSFKKTRELLEFAQSIHRRVKCHYEQEKASLKKDDAKMLLEYISRKEGRLPSMISQYLKEAPADILDAYYQFPPAEVKLIEDYTAWRPHSKASTAEVLSVALKIDSFMQTFYRRAAQMAPSEAVGEVFRNLAEAVKAKKRDQASNVALFEDI
jgi:hypothetical protein